MWLRVSHAPKRLGKYELSCRCTALIILSFHCAETLPQVGHEIVGRAVRVGAQAEGGIRVGDRVGVGAQSSACLRPDCEDCSNGLENHCRNANVNTYNDFYPDSSKSMGGYAQYCRVPSHFVIKIPLGLSSSEAAPMLCGGVTTYTPLVENGAGPGMKVGVVGVGGLGHFGLIWAKVARTPLIIPRQHADQTI